MTWTAFIADEDKRRKRAKKNPSETGRNELWDEGIGIYWVSYQS